MEDVLDVIKVCLLVKKAGHTWNNIVDMQKKGTFNTCKTAQLYSIISSIPVSNRIILKIEQHITCIPKEDLHHTEYTHMSLGI